MIGTNERPNKLVDKGWSTTILLFHFVFKDILFVVVIYIVNVDRKRACNTSTMNPPLVFFGIGTHAWHIY
jgi:hypothetical protein